MDAMDYVMHSPPEQSAARPLYPYHHQTPRCPYRASHFPYYELSQTHHQRATNAYDPVHSIPVHPWSSYPRPPAQSSSPNIWSPSQPQLAPPLSSLPHQHPSHGQSSGAPVREDMGEQLETPRAPEQQAFLRDRMQWFEQQQQQQQQQYQQQQQQQQQERQERQQQQRESSPLIHSQSYPYHQERYEPSGPRNEQTALENTSRSGATVAGDLPAESHRRQGPIVVSGQRSQPSHPLSPTQAAWNGRNSSSPSTRQQISEQQAQLQQQPREESHLASMLAADNQADHQPIQQEQSGRQLPETEVQMETTSMSPPQIATASTSTDRRDELPPLFPERSSQSTSGVSNTLSPRSPRTMADQANYSGTRSQSAALTIPSAPSNVASTPASNGFVDSSRTSPSIRTAPHTHDAPSSHIAEAGSSGSSSGSSSRSGGSTPSPPAVPSASTAPLGAPIAPSVRDQRRTAFATHRRPGNNSIGGDSSHSLDHGSDDEADVADEQHALHLLEQFSSSLYSGTSPSGDDRIRAQQILRGALTNKRVASKSAIASLQSVDIDSLEASERMCIICYNDFGKPTPEGISEAPLRLPKCKHVFGDHCIKKWFEESDSCPYCRDKVQSESQFRAASQAIHQYIRAHQHLANRRVAMGPNSSSGPTPDAYPRMAYHRERDALPDMGGLFNGGHSRIWASGERRGSTEDSSNDGRRRTRARHGSFRASYTSSSPLNTPNRGSASTAGTNTRHHVSQPLGSQPSTAQTQFAPQMSYPQANHQPQSSHPLVVPTPDYQGPNSRSRYGYALAEQQRLSVWGPNAQHFAPSGVNPLGVANASRHLQSYGPGPGPGPDTAQLPSSHTMHPSYPGVPFSVGGSDAPTAFPHTHIGPAPVLPPPSMPASVGQTDGRIGYGGRPYNPYSSSMQAQAPVASSEMSRDLSGFSSSSSATQPTLLPPISSVETQHEFPHHLRIPLSEWLS